MGLHAFQSGNAGGRQTNVPCCFAGHLLPSKGFEEFVHRQAARIPSRSLGGQNMVGAAGFVAIGHRGFLAQKQGAIAGQCFKPPIQVGRVNL